MNRALTCCLQPCSCSLVCGPVVRVLYRADVQSLGQTGHSVGEFKIALCTDPDDIIVMATTSISVLYGGLRLPHPTTAMDKTRVLLGNPAKRGSREMLVYFLQNIPIRAKVGVLLERYQVELVRLLKFDACSGENGFHPLLAVGEHPGSADEFLLKDCLSRAIKLVQMPFYV